MLSLWITNIYIFVLALTLAVLEIQIEGREGWAKNLPTWRPRPDSRTAVIFSKIMSGRETTGYHITMFAFVFLIFYFPYAFGIIFLTPANFLATLSLFFLFIVLWDFLWFVLNPHYPLKNFKKEHIWWHKKWLLGLPRDYYFSTSLSLLMALLAGFYSVYGGFGLWWWLLNLSMFLAEIAAAVLFTLYVLDIDNWRVDGRRF